jgi:serine phosphatase RsbU (regulator of sigma subunit)
MMEEFDPKTQRGWLADAWRLYSRLGTADGANDALARRIILSNQVAAVVFVMGLGVTLYFLSGEYSSITLYWFMLLLGAVWIMPFLNAMGNTGVSRLILSSLMPLFMVGIVSHTRVATPDEVHGASFYIPRFYMMAIGFFPLLLFTAAERARLYISLGLNVLIMLFFNELLDLFGAGMGLLEPQVEDAFFISISSVLSMLVIGSGFYFLNNLNNRHEQRIQELLEETEEKNARIESAIAYAKDIQQTILPPKALEEKLSDNLFVLFRPLDVVSGDFYLLQEKDDQLLFGVIDCTGHGVPGAFVSLLAHSALRRAIMESGMASPAQVLGLTNNLFHQDFTKSGTTHQRDGMELVLCSLDRKSLQLRVSGTNLYCFVVSDGELTSQRCDRGSISPGNPERVFSEHVIQLKKGDTVYLSSDGLPDQFGGPNDKRMGRKAMTQLFTSVSDQSLPNQRDAVQSAFEEWKGHRFQVDDVCVMGVRV